MSDGGAFALGIFAVCATGLFVLWLWAKYHVETESHREQTALAEFGPLFQMDPMKRHVGSMRSTRVFRYHNREIDWEAMRKAHKTDVTEVSA